MKLASLLLAFAATLASAQGAKPDTTVITGTVTDRQGKPIAGATVLVANTGANGATFVTTNAKGQYSVVLTDGGTTYRVAVLRLAGTGQQTVTRRNSAPIMVNFFEGLIVPLTSQGSLPTGPVGPPTFASTSIPRSALGSADAITVAMQRGRIAVTGNDDSTVTYGLGRHPGCPDSTVDGGFDVVRSGFAGGTSGPVGVCERARTNVPGTAAAASVVFDGPYTATFDPDGLKLGIPAVDEKDGGLELRLVVPRNLKLLKLSIGTNGIIDVSNFDGELSIESERGPVLLNGIGGSALVEARNGRIRATVTHVPPPGTGGLNFLGRNGDIVVTLPANAQFDYDLEAHGTGHLSSDFPLDAAAVQPPGEHLPINASDLEKLKALAPGVVFTAGGSAATFVPLTRTGHVNGGGAMIKLAALNGSVVITRGPP